MTSQTHNPNVHPGGGARRRTLLRCPLGNHKGHFELQRFGKTWGCAECVRLAGRQFVGLSIAQTASPKAEGGAAPYLGPYPIHDHRTCADLIDGGSL